MNKILCPVDFSDASVSAIQFAAEIGSKFHSHLVLINVFTERDFNKVVGDESVGKSFKGLIGMAKNRLQVLANEVNESYNLVNCTYELELGGFIDTINRVASTENFDLIVMGTTGVSKSDGIFFGSNTADVIDSVNIPILCIPEGCEYNGFRKLVYATDFLASDKIAIQEVISFATTFDARISVMHVNASDSDKDYQTFVKDLKSFIQYNKIGFVNRKYENVGQGIREFVDEEDADLLVVYKRHRSFVEGIFHKSITKLLSYSSDKPLFVLKLEKH